MRFGRAILLTPRLAHDVDRVDVLELDRVRAVGREVDRQVVDLLRHPGRRGVDTQLRRIGARALEAEYHVVGGKWRSVVELDAGAQLEAPRRRVDLGPRFGECGLKPQFLVANDQKFVDELVDVIGKAFVLRVRVRGLHVAAACPAKRFRVGWRGNGGKRGSERQCQNRET